MIISWKELLVILKLLYLNYISTLDFQLEYSSSFYKFLIFIKREKFDSSIILLLRDYRHVSELVS